MREQNKDEMIDRLLKMIRELNLTPLDAIGVCYGFIGWIVANQFDIDTKTMSEYQNGETDRLMHFIEGQTHGEHHRPDRGD